VIDVRQPYQSTSTAAPAPVRHGVVVGNTRLFIPKGTRSELVPMSTGCRLPGAPVWFGGFINHRGDVIPVFNLSMLVNPRSEDLVQPKWALLLDSAPETIGILTNDYPASLDEYEQCNMPSDIAPMLQPFVQAAYDANDQVWLELDHRALFTSLVPQFSA